MWAILENMREFPNLFQIKVRKGQIKSADWTTLSGDIDKNWQGYTKSSTPNVLKYVLKFPRKRADVVVMKGW